MISTPLSFSLAEACGTDPTATCRFVFDLTGNGGLAGWADLLFLPVKVLVILLLAFFAARLARRAIERTVRRVTAAQARRVMAAEEEAESDDATPGRTRQLLSLRRAQRAALLLERGKQRAETIGGVLRSVAAVFVYTVAALVILGEFEINLGPLIASAGIVGIALGFGAQSLVKDFLSGIFMVLEDQYGVGDVVDLGEASGW